MGKPTGFMEFKRETPTRRTVSIRLNDWNEIYEPFPEDKLRAQGARCMDCGIPFCHGHTVTGGLTDTTGCPLGNLIPDWNDAVYRGRWKDALDLLFKTNNFPEFTGRICPAPCEEACVLGINEKPVTIKNIELSIIERAFENGWVKAEPPQHRTGKTVAVIGSGPAGLGCAAQLNKAGHAVTVFERADKVGGLLMYGIPEFKLEKKFVERRVKILEEEGIKFVTNANVGVNVNVADLKRDFDAIVLCGGATKPRDLPVPGRDLKGIHFAMDYLPQGNRRALGWTVDQELIDAKGKHVVILGGGDTGADCLGTAERQGAASIHQFELLPKPPDERSLDVVKDGKVLPWPYWPMVYRTSSAHEEAAELFGADVRDFSINTKKFTGADGKVKKLHGVRLEWVQDANGRFVMAELPGSEFELDCDLCLLALGFLSPEHTGPVDQLGLTKDGRGNVKVDENYMTNVPGIFAAGDMRRGQSLVVWAISEGRQAARSVDQFLMGKTDLPYLKLF